VARFQQTRAIELAPVVFAEAERDQVAAEIVDRLAAEVVALARVALARLDLTDEPVEVLLGGGLIEAGDGRLVGAVRAALTEIGPALTVQRTASPPIAGAALLALDRLGVTHEAKERARAELTSIAPEAGD
jgi:N-acetylglucosamine kinase-like BadF-type ATPase